MLLLYSNNIVWNPNFVITVYKKHTINRNIKKIILNHFLKKLLANNLLEITILLSHLLINILGCTWQFVTANSWLHLTLTFFLFASLVSGTDETTHAASMIVTNEAADKIWQLYQSNSDRDGKNSEKTPFRSVRVQWTAPCRVENEHRAALSGRRIRPFRHLQHLGTIRQQSEHRKKAWFRTSDDPERQEATKNAKEEDREKSGYIAACAWPGGRRNRPNSEKVPGEHEHTCQEAEVPSTGFGAAGNDAATAAG